MPTALQITKMMAVADLAVVTVLIFNFGHYVSSEERVLGYGTKFGTVGNLEKSKVIGEVIQLITFPPLTHIISTNQALELLLALSAESQRRSCWMFTIATSSTGTCLVRSCLRDTEKTCVWMAALRALTAHTDSVFAI